MVLKEDNELINMQPAGNALKRFIDFFKDFLSEVVT